jgi:hypothetical protein
MTVDIESIGVGFDTSSVNAGAKALDNLGTSADKASKTADNLTETVKRQNKQMQDGVAQIQKTAAATDQTASSVSKLIDKYDPLGVKLRKIQADFEAMNKAAAGGQVAAIDDSRLDSAYANIQKELKALSSAEAEFGDASEKAMGKSAFATAGARREVIVLGHEVVSGNFNRIPGSLMVLAERTGAAAEGFIAAAAAGVAVAAVIGTVVYAAIKGAQSIEEMNKALVSTSDYSGQTINSLNAVAVQVSNTSKFTIGQSKELVTTLAASGKVSSETFQMLASLVAQYSDVTGTAADKSAEYIVKLFSDPTKGAIELNKTMHFLGAAEIERIYTLQRTGHEIEAQLLLADKYKDKLDEETHALGFLESAWLSVKKGASSYFDTLKSLGGGDTVAQQIKLLQNDIAAFSNPATAASTIGVEQARLRVLSDQLEITRLVRQERAKDADAAAASEAAQKIDADNELATLRNNSSELFKHQKIREEIIRLQAAQAGLSGQDALINADAIKQLEKQLVNKKELAALTKAENEERRQAIKSLQEQEYLEDVTIPTERNKALKKAADDYQKLIDEEQKKVEELSSTQIKSLDAAIAAQKLHNAEIGKTPEQIALVKAATEDATTAQLQNESVALRSAAELADMSEQFKAIYIDRANALDVEISKRMEIAGLLNDAAIMEANDTAAKKAAEAWKKATEEINRALTDALMRGFESGKSFAQNFRDTLKNMFKTLILQPIVKFLVDSSGLATAIAAITPGSASASPSSSPTGGIDMVSTLKNGFSALSSGVDNLNTSFVDGIASVGTGLRSVGFDQLGTLIENNSTMLGDIAPYAAGALSLIKGDYQTAALQTIGAVIGSYFGPVGGMIGSYLGGLVSSFIGGPGHKETHSYASTLVSGNSASTIDAFNTYGRGGSAGAKDFGSKSGMYLGNAIDTLATAYGGSVDPFTLGTKYNSKYDTYSVNVGSAVSSKKGSVSDFTFKSDQATNGAAEAFLLAVKKGFVTLPDYLQNIVKRSTIDINNAQIALSHLSGYVQLNAELKDLPPIFNSIGDAIKNVASANNYASIQAKFNAINTYVGLFYTDQEKLATFTKQLNTQFASLNVALPDSRDGFRQLVDGIDTTKASGLTLFNTLVGLAPTMDSYYTALQQQADATNQAADAAKQLADNLSTSGFATLVDYTRAQRYIQSGTVIPNLPSFAVGTNSLPGDMQIQAHAGERIVPAADNRELMARLRDPQANYAAVVDEIKRLRADLQAQNLANVQANQQTAKILDRFDTDGLPPTRT